MTSDRSWRWLPPEGPGLDAVTALAAARGWTVTADRAPTLFAPRSLEWSDGAGLRVRWDEFHEFGARRLWVEHNDASRREAALAELTRRVPTWPIEQIRSQATRAPLIPRLRAMRAWTLTATWEDEPALPDALAALARDDDPVARASALTLAYRLSDRYPAPMRELAEQRATADEGPLAAGWRQLADALADASAAT